MWVDRVQTCALKNIKTTCVCTRVWGYVCVCVHAHECINFLPATAIVLILAGTRVLLSSRYFAPFSNPAEGRSARRNVPVRLQYIRNKRPVCKHSISTSKASLRQHIPRKTQPFSKSFFTPKQPVCFTPETTATFFPVKHSKYWT